MPGDDNHAVGSETSGLQHRQKYFINQNNDGGKVWTTKKQLRKY
ncbi:hypothetical protein IMSAGC002_00128 [Lachnospiraceae bacterium]|nr:hypothetical protein IMSAGC002_00128 [Lachnospiraceae bacterium]